MYAAHFYVSKKNNNSKTKQRIEMFVILVQSSFTNRQTCYDIKIHVIFITAFCSEDWKLDCTQVLFLCHCASPSLSLSASFYGHVTFVFLYCVNSAVFMYGCLHRDGEVLCKSVMLRQRKTETGLLLTIVLCEVLKSNTTDMKHFFFTLHQAVLSSQDTKISKPSVSR